jgi:Trp operon repressor
MVNAKDRAKFRDELVSVIAAAGSSQSLLAKFLEDLFTPTEFDEVAARWQIVKLLKAEVPHHEIAKRTHTAVATVTRGSREMKDPQGGFQAVLHKLNQSNPPTPK